MPKREWKRENVWLRMLVASPTGGGKTMGALAVASTLFDGVLPVVGIDTEHERMKLYADLVGIADYRVIEKDFAPATFIREIDEAEAEFPGGVLVIDSVTHEWSGRGGVLEIVDKGKGGNWKEGTPEHNKFTERIMACQMHVICCVRSKMKYDWSPKENGKIDIRRLGVGPEQRDNFPYDYDIEADIDLESHLATFTKARNCRALAGKTMSLVPDLDDLRAPNAVADMLSSWLSEGEAPKPPEKADPAAITKLRALLNEDGISDELVDRGFAVARRENRGELHPDYVAEKTAAVVERLEKKQKRVAAGTDAPAEPEAEPAAA